MPTKALLKGCARHGKRSTFYFAPTALMTALLFSWLLKVGPLSKKWLLQHRDYREGKHFKDVQVEGPFKHWEHSHHFERLSDNECILKDTIHYELPFGALGERLLDRFVRNKLKKILKYRHGIVKRDLEIHRRKKNTVSLKILIAGASGFIGSALVPFLSAGGHRVSMLSTSNKSGAIYWNPSRA